MPELRQIVTVDCPRMMARMHGPCGVHCPGLRLLINANTLKFDRADNTSPFRCEQYPGALAGPLARFSRSHRSRRGLFPLGSDGEPYGDCGAEPAGPEAGDGAGENRPGAAASERDRDQSDGTGAGAGADRGLAAEPQAAFLAGGSMLRMSSR